MLLFQMEQMFKKKFLKNSIFFISWFHLFTCIYLTRTVSLDFSVQFNTRSSCIITIPEYLNIGLNYLYL